MKPTQIVAPLLDWYARSHRLLPWRMPPGSAVQADPYRVWLSEIMLQQTTVAAVIPYFERFLARWPTVDALASAEDAEVMSAWAGLGYYARARNMLACARVIAGERDGRFPETEAELAALPGIGPYTAAAIAAIAFGAAANVVDGNVERVIARLFAVETPLPDAKPALRRLAASLVPGTRPGDYAQALMDLGATICRPRQPACGDCPIAPACAARTGQPERFPARRPRKPRPLRRAAALAIVRDGRLLVARRPPKGLLGGMYGLPMSEIVAADAKPSLPLGIVRCTGALKKNGEVRHVFTHFELALEVFSGAVESTTVADGEWIDLARVTALGLPALFAKAVEVACGVPRSEGQG
jgi:A/G-specific adenine glycosylase